MRLKIIGGVALLAAVFILAQLWNYGGDDLERIDPRHLQKASAGVQAVAARNGESKSLEAAAASLGLSVAELKRKAAEGSKALLARGRARLAAATTSDELRAAFLDIQAAADAGNADASLQLGKMLEEGIGTRRDLSAAFASYLAAARAGQPAAQLKVAAMFEAGEGIDVNYAAAAKWYEEAAKSGQTDGWVFLGYLHSQGRGVAQDYGRALDYYRKAAGAGNVDALGALAMARVHGWGVPGDPAAGMNDLADAAGRGSARAAIGLSKLLADGFSSGQPDIVGALDWLKRAAELDDKQAQVLLARQLATGAWGELDMDRAIALFIEAADNGSAQALTDLGKVTTKTSPDSKGFKQALDYARDAHLAGNTDAALLLAQLSLANPPTPEAEKHIRAALKVAADEGSWRARYATELLAQGVAYTDAVLQASSATKEDVVNKTLADRSVAPQSSPAVALSMPPPQFDASVLAQGLTGTINVNFTVDQNGRAGGIKLGNPASPAVEAAIKDAVKNWRFQPAMKAGKPVRMRMSIPISIGKSQ